MSRIKWLSKTILLSLMLSISIKAIAAADFSLLEMSEQMDGIDKQDFQSAINKANACIRARNFSCAESELAKAVKAANGGQDKKLLLAAQNGLKSEKQALANEIRRAEEQRLAQVRRDEEERLAQIKREEEREAQERQYAQEAERQASTIDYGPGISPMQSLNNNIASLNNLNRIMVDGNNELNRVRASQAAEQERIARAKAQRSADAQQAQVTSRQERLQKQARLEEQNQRERDQQRADTERRNQELRDSAERKRIAAAEEAQRKADKEREVQAEKQARAQYLKNVASGTRLVATKCPDGEGKYYATGTRPKIKPEVVSCVDIRFRAYCPDSRQYSEGVAHIFVGMAGCFGDTYAISPTPGCKVDQVRIEVVEARECSN
jgi:hypothetical protein